jgi:hypothetical protein
MGKVRNVSMLYRDVTVSIKSKVVMREKLFAVGVYLTFSQQTQVDTCSL